MCVWRAANMISKRLAPVFLAPKKSSETMWVEMCREYESRVCPSIDIFCKVEKDHSGKLERIYPSINFSNKISRIHAKETQKSFDPTKAKCCKLVQQRRQTWSLKSWRSSFLRIYEKTMNRQTRCCKLSRSTDRHDPECNDAAIMTSMTQQTWLQFFCGQKHSWSRYFVTWHVTVSGDGI